MIAFFNTSPNSNPLGSATGSYTEGNFTYASGIDNITNLYARYSYDAGFSNCPIVLIIAGWGGNATSIDSATMRRWAARGYFALVAGMRGRNSASGARDASAREIYDLYDAVKYVQQNFGVTNKRKVTVIGYSGGGGNALALCAKFPDLVNVGVSFFGMSDYGYDGTDGWYFTNSSYASEIATAVGDTPANVPNKYRSRYILESLPGNFTGGYLLLYHSPSDSLVNVVHSDNVKAAFDSAAKTNYELNRSTDYAHGYPNDVEALRNVEPDILAKSLAQKPWTFPAVGSIRVSGYIKTKRFEIRLGNMDNHVADVAYNTNDKSYTITPITGEMSVTVLQDGTSATQTISAETTIQL